MVQRFGRGVVRDCHGGIICRIRCHEHFGVFWLARKSKELPGTAQDEQTKAMRWEYATQFSFPGVESRQVVVPGFLAIAMGGTCGGASNPRTINIGDPLAPVLPICGDWLEPGFTPAFWLWIPFALAGDRDAIVSRTRLPFFTAFSDALIWFWGKVVLVVSFLLALGQVWPSHRFFYALPYASTIRSPVRRFYARI